MTTNERLTIALTDKQFQDHLVKEAREEGDSRFTVAEFDDNGCIGIENELGARPFVAGDTLRLFGRGFGYVVRGIGLVENGELTALYRYRTEEEEVAHHKKEVEETHNRKKKEWEANKEKTALEIKAMPEPFQKRIEFFMRNPDWGWENGPYEIFCCKEAIKIIAVLKTPEEAQAFHKLDWEEQRKVVPDLDYNNHSGNTFGASVNLAHVYLTFPEDLYKFHGALCPLMGCKEYGCWASTEEAQKSRESREEAHG